MHGPGTAGKINVWSQFKTKQEQGCFTLASDHTKPIPHTQPDTLQGQAHTAQTLHYPIITHLNAIDVLEVIHKHEVADSTGIVFRTPIKRHAGMASFIADSSA